MVKLYINMLEVVAMMGDCQPAGYSSELLTMRPNSLWSQLA